MKRDLILMASIVLGLSGCTSSVDHLMEPSKPASRASKPAYAQQSYAQQHFEEPTAEKQEAYEKKMITVASGIIIPQISDTVNYL